MLPCGASSGEPLAAVHGGGRRITRAIGVHAIHTSATPVVDSANLSGLALASPRVHPLTAGGTRPRRVARATEAVGPTVEIVRRLQQSPGLPKYWMSPDRAQGQARRGIGMIERVLLVDDEEPLLKAYRRFLQPNGSSDDPDGRRS